MERHGKLWRPIKKRCYNCASDSELEWLAQVLSTLDRYVKNKYRELDMVMFIPYYKAGYTPLQVAAMLVQNNAYDSRTTKQYEQDVVYGRQGPTTYNGTLLKYLPTYFKFKTDY